MGFSMPITNKILHHLKPQNSADIAETHKTRYTGLLMVTIGACFPHTSQMLFSGKPKRNSSPRLFFKVPTDSDETRSAGQAAHCGRPGEGSLVPVSLVGRSLWSLSVSAEAMAELRQRLPIVSRHDLEGADGARVTRGRW